jgi:ornithine carbamoyltransferase
VSDGLVNSSSGDLRGRSLLKELDFTQHEWKGLLDLSAKLKAAKYAGSDRRRLEGKNIALVFEKSSTRTRCAFEVAAHDQGAHVTYLDPTGSQLGHKESIRDTGRVLGRMYEASSTAASDRQGWRSWPQQQAYPCGTG